MSLYKTLQYCIQLCINSYKGEYGEYEEVLRDRQEFNKDHVEGHWGYKAGKLYIVFRGSDGVRDWIDNFKFWKTDVRKVNPYGNIDSKIRVHAGFIGQYKSIRDYIHKVVEENEAMDVIVTGHSLGGALATLCGLDIQYNFSNFVTVVTFGSPRVGNGHFRDSYNKRIDTSYRFVYRDDIVCKVPMPVFGYRHVDKIYRLGKKRWFTFFGWYGDHYPRKYKEALQ